MGELTEAEAAEIAMSMANELYPPDITTRKRVIALGNKLSNVINASRTDNAERSCAVIGLLAKNCTDGPDARVMEMLVHIILGAWVAAILREKELH